MRPADRFRLPSVGVDVDSGAGVVSDTSWGGGPAVWFSPDSDGPEWASDPTG